MGDSRSATRVLGWCRWAGAVGLVTLLAAVYAASKVHRRRSSVNKFPLFTHTTQSPHPTKKTNLLTYFPYQMPVSCPRQIPCPGPESLKPEGTTVIKGRMPLDGMPKAPDCLTGSALPPWEKRRRNRDFVASYALGALTGALAPGRQCRP